MADKPQVVKDAPTNGQQVTFTLPEGMSPEQFKGLFGTFNKNVVRGRKVGKADSQAVRRLLNAHKEQLLGFRKEEWKKEGLDSSKLTIRNR